MENSRKAEADRLLEQSQKLFESYQLESSQLFFESPQLEEILPLLQQARVIYREISNSQGEATVLHMLKDALDKLLDNCDSQKESALAVDYLKQSVSVAREIGDVTSEVCKLCCLGNAYWFSGDYARGSESWQQSVKTAQESGNRYQEKCALSKLGMVCSRLGEYTRAILLVNSLCLGREPTSRCCRVRLF